jgi:hypothetical protein
LKKNKGKNKMPDPVIHSNVTLPLVGSGLSAVIGMVFGLDTIALFCAIFGAFIGIAFRPAMPEGLSRVALIIRFFLNLAYVIITTVIAAFAVSWWLKYSTTEPYPLAFFTAMALMIFREKVVDGLGSVVDSVFKRLNHLVDGDK